MKECEALGARFELLDIINNWKDMPSKPLWLKNAKYRIKGGITPEQFKKHHKEIVAWWDGAEIEYLSSDGEWWATDTLCWDIDTEYRVKEPKTKTVYEWMFKHESHWKPYYKFITEEEAKDYFTCEYKKTGRSWEV